MQEQIESRYGLRTTGRVEDFFAIKRLYDKESTEGKKELARLIGTPRQSNAFAAFLAALPDVAPAAAESLLRIDAALEENAKVTNTASAAWQRAKSSWDGFVNQPGFGAYATQQFDILSGAIAGLTPNRPGQLNIRQRFFNPQHATGWGTILGLSNFATAGIGKTVGEAIFGPKYEERYWNLLGYSHEPTTPGDIYQTGMDKVMKHRSAAQAYRLMALRGNPSEAADYEKKRQHELELEKQELVVLRNQEASLAKRAATASERQEHLENWKQLQEQIKNIGKEESETIDGTNLKFAHLADTMERVKGISADITRAFGEMGLSPRVAEMTDLAQRIQVMEGMKASMEGSGEFSTLDIAEFARGLRTAKARQKYLGSPEGEFYNAWNVRTGIAAHMAGGEIEAHGVGLSEGERLLDRQRWIQAELDRLNKSRAASTYDLIRGNKLTEASLATQLSIQERILKNEQERRQVLMEAQREFQKSLITAGPGDILRKLATSTLMGRGGFNAGNFFALSSEARADAYMMMGGSRMAELNAEARALRGVRRMTPEAMGNTAVALDAQSAKYSEVIRGALADGAAKVQSSMATAAEHSATIALNFSRIAAEFAYIRNSSGRAPVTANAPMPAQGDMPPQAPAFNTMPAGQYGPPTPALPGLQHYSGFH